MNSTHVCDLCYTNLEHNKLQRMGPYSYRWRLLFAEGLATRAAAAPAALLKDFFLSTFLVSFIDITYNAEYLKVLDKLLHNSRYGPQLDDILAHQITSLYTQEYYSFWMKPVLRMLLAEPRVREWVSAMSEVEEDWYQPRADTPIIVDTWKSVRRCARIKGELVERAWHPDRVWDWCFDEEEKREIGGAE